MADVIMRSTEPTLAAIKLAWWRERLEDLDEGKITAEPRLQAAAAQLLPRGISGAELGQLEEGWATLLQENPDTERALNRGATLFGLAARLIDRNPPDLLASAGRLYASGRLQRVDRASKEAGVVTPCRTVPSAFRRLTGLAVLSRRDLNRREPEATPARAWALLRHRFTGRI